MEGLEVISINYEDPTLPKLVREFRPAVYLDGQDYCCLLGPDPQEGIFGCGHNRQDAINDWIQHFNERISKPAANDKVATEIIDSLSISKGDVW